MVAVYAIRSIRRGGSRGTRGELEILEEVWQNAFESLRDVTRGSIRFGRFGSKKEALLSEGNGLSSNNRCD